MTRDEVYEAEAIIKNLAHLDVAEEKKKEIKRLIEIFEPVVENERIKDFKKARGLKYSWHSFNPLIKLQEAITTLSAVITYHQEAKIEEDVFEKETQDLLHALEITEPDDQKILEYGKEIQIIRQKRRIAKDFMEVAAPLFTYACHNRKAVKELGQVLNEMQQIVDNLQNRTYKVREKTMLQEAFDKARVINRNSAMKDAFAKAGIVS